MTATVLCLKKGRSRAGFMRDAKQAGVTLEPIAGLKRHFRAEGDVSAIADHPAIEAMSDADRVIPPPAVQSITLDNLLVGGSWALARTIRRGAPWNVDHVKSPIDTFYRYERDGTGVDIYVVDSGIELAHAEFGGRATNVYEYASSGGAGDDSGHGTAVASVAAGATAGPARGALLWSFKSSTSSAGGSTDLSLVTALGQLNTHYAGRAGLNRPAVVNLSINPVHGATVVSAIGDLIDDGLVCVQSAGNDKAELVIGTYPAAFTADSIIAGGTGIADIPYFYGLDGTNYGSAVHILAPGIAVRVAAATVRAAGDYEARRGTSFSSPLVAGVIACMLQGHNRLTTRTQVQAVKTKLLANATTGKLRTAYGLAPLPDKILYLDPVQVAPETISGL
ncbi:S8 family serine peptidase [Mesorhizobium sp.]|uniref:S8 family serine peptidase n=1 Tax=Mesorhizobium sp. TaxID=1871066 RepID=UPI001226A2E5|nr:S8 family serine peptidase [Mesorhizobium sp.]TIN76792.1 MAG: hypothetical protein E5Y09_21110 [Mesorhizobium sp.]